MTVKEQVLLALEENKVKPVSGEELAEKIGCSRNAVWKAVKTLQAEGYGVTGINNRGYTLIHLKAPARRKARRSSGSRRAWIRRRLDLDSQSKVNRH